MEGQQLFEIVTYDELVERLKVPRRTLERYVSKGKIPHRRLGKRVLFYWPAIVQWLQNDGAKRR
jgi:excisionase family DNA binding protein